MNTDKIKNWIVVWGLLLTWRAGAAEKIVCLGDSITDGHTYPQLVRQALQEAGKEAPVVVNAGIGGDTAAGMLARLDRDAFVHKPTIMTLSVGINDSGRVPAADFERDVTAIADRVAKEKVRLVIFTTSILGPRMGSRVARIDEYDAILRKVAAAHRAPVAEVKALMTAARDAGELILETDQVHPNLAGQRLIARAMLDALGHKDVPVPKEMKTERLPGLIADWQMRPLAEKEILNDAAAAALAPDTTWKSIHLPQPHTEPVWWMDGERRRGFAVSLDKWVGPGKRFVGVSTISSETARRAYLNTGAHLTSIRLNGKQVFQSTVWTGWHAGKERIAVELPAGKSTLVIETGPAFFLSLTDDNDW